jgi:hypothetical protein
MVDNFSLINDLLEFEEGYFYFLQIIQRKKDHKKRKVNGTNNHSRLVRAYYVHSQEYFDFIKPEAIELCKLFNARAGINLNRRSYERMAFHTLRKVTDQIMNKDYRHIHKAYHTVCGKYSQESDKRWILDVDDVGRSTNDFILFAERECEPEGEKYIATIPSKNGYHVIMRPFNRQRFSQAFPEIEIHPNNPTNLYIP